MSTPTSSARPRVDRRFATAVVISFVAVSAVSVTSVSWPHVVGSWAVQATATLILVTLGVGPLVRGARPVLLWLALLLAAMFSVMGVVGHPDGLRRQGGAWSDTFILLSYVAYSVWFLSLARRIGRITLAAVVDSAAAATAAVLTLWAIPRSYVVGHGLPHLLQWAIYPILDAVVFLLIGDIALGVGRRIGAWWWAFGAMGVLLVLDLAVFYAGPGLPTGGVAVLGAGYLVAYWGLAVATCHPSVRDLSHTLVEPRSHAPTWRALVLYLTVFPGVASLALPSITPGEAQVRTTLVLVLVALLLVRLLGTMISLSAAERRSRHRASHDAVTGLLNRAGLLAELDSRRARTRQEGASTALLFLDCDNFKGVNDTWGHPAGDAFLVEVSRGLPSFLRNGDILARHGGDEFAVVASVRTTEEAEQLAARVHDFFETPIALIGDLSHVTTVSVGIAVATPDEDLTAMTLLERADIALHAAKTRGRSQTAVYDDDLDEATRTRSRVSASLRRGIDRRLSVSLRPVLGGPGLDAPTGWEALPQWEDPESGPVPSEVFVPLAEELGLLGDLDRHVMRTALSFLAGLQRDDPDTDMRVTVDVSRSCLCGPDFTSRVEDALATAGVAPSRLVVEVHESLLVDDSSTVFERLGRLRELGVSVCVDEFGTGHASLTALLRAPVDAVKLDRSLVARIDSSPQDARRLGALVRLLTQLGVRSIVADGVERPAQLAQVRAWGCSAAQGPLFGSPVTPADLFGAPRPTPHPPGPTPLVGTTPPHLAP